MPLRHITHASLNNGVSRQSPVLRLDSQAQEQINYLSEVTGGPKDRPPAQLLTLPGGAAFAADSFTHPIDRDESEQYLVVIPGDGTVRVFDQHGVEQTVNAISPADQLYLTATGDPRKVFRAHSVVDTTFITNREIETEIDTSTRSPAEENIALFWVRQTMGNTDFLIKMKHAYDHVGGGASLPWRSGDLTGSNANPTYFSDDIDVDYDTPDATLVLRVEMPADSNATESPTRHTNWAARRIVQGLSDMIGEHLSAVGGDTYGRSLRTWSLDTPPTTNLYSGTEQGWQALRGSVFWLRSSAPSDDEQVRFSVDDGMGGEAFKVAHRAVEQLSDLPGTGAPTGFKIRVQEQTGDELDDWYVQYDGSSWREVVGFDVALGFDAATMPHVLRRESNGTFTFEPAAWAVRAAGDETSVPDPGFIGKPIQAIKVYKNRLALVYEDGVAFSEAGEFLNFWKTTSRQILSADAFDISVDAGGGAAKYEDAYPFNQVLTLWSRTSQAVVRGTDVFSVETVSADVATDYKASLTVSPLSTGSTLLFQSPAGNVWEWAASRGNEVYFGIDITAHIEGYLPGLFSWGAISRAHDIAVFGHDSDPTKLWVYRYFFDEERKLQSSWSVWQLADGIEIYGGAFLNCQLLAIGRATTAGSAQNVTMRLCLEGLGPEDGFGGFHIRLDLKKTATVGPGAYSALTGTTTITAPYAIGANDEVFAVLGVGSGDRMGEMVQVTGSGTTTVTIPGEVPEAAEVHIGLKFTRLYEPSRLILRTQQSTGGSAVPVTNRRVQARRATLNLQNAGNLSINVYRDDELISSTSYTPVVVGGDLVQVVPEPYAEVTFDIGTDASSMRIQLVNDSYLPCEILSIAYEAIYHSSRSRRLT